MASRTDSEPVGIGPHHPAPFQAVGFKLSSLGHAVARQFKAALEPFGLEPREFALLRVVGFAEGRSQQALGESLQIPASRMVALVDALEERGVLERRANPHDRRARALFLTEQGRQLLLDASTAASEYERALTGDLDEREREQLIATLDRIATRLGLDPAVHSAQSEAHELI
jgi:DNA-binding MarR family transcriptional regulator